VGRRELGYTEPAALRAAEIAFGDFRGARLQNNYQRPKQKGNEDV